MKLILLSVVLFTAVTLHAQTAKVIQLTPEDAAQAKSLQDQKEALDKRISDFNAGVTKHYLLETRRANGLVFCNGASPCDYKPGWWGGFEYSDDFKFIVPAASKPSTTCPSWIYGGTTLTTSPGFILN